MQSQSLILLVIVSLITLLVGCKSGSDISIEDRRVLRIGTLSMSYENEVDFRSRYTDLFEFENPDIEIEIVSADQGLPPHLAGPDWTRPDPMKGMKELLTGAHPVDVVILDFNLLRRLIQENMLKQLDPLIRNEEDEIDISNYVPAVVDALREAGDGSLYALTQTFTSSALFYNKKLFQKAGIEVPTDGMTWPEIFMLAERVKQANEEDKAFGLQFSRWSGESGFFAAFTYAGSLQLKVFDDKGEKMTVNTPDWERVWTTVAKLYRDSTVPAGDVPREVYNGDLFLHGDVVMTLADYGYVFEIMNVNRNADKIKGFQPLEWDVVSTPQHPEKPGIGGDMKLTPTMAINAKALNAEDAWEYIKFMNSERWAKLKSRDVYGLLARKEFLVPSDDASFNIEAFAKLKPIPPASRDQEKIYRELPNVWEIRNLGAPLFDEVVKGTKTVKEALAEWEINGNEMLQKSRLETS